MEETLYRDDRFPCPRCGEGVLPAASVCPYCRGAVLFDVVVIAPLAGRAAYEAARELAEVPGAPPFLAAKRALDRGGRLATAITHQLAGELLAVLAAYQAGARLEPAEGATAATPRTDASRRLPGSPLTWSALAIAAALLGIAWLATRDEAPAPASRVGSVRPASATRPAVETPLAATEIARLAARSTAALRCGSSAGSGFFVGPDRLVTNAHVLCGDAELRVLMADGRELVGRPERSDERLDLALVHVGDAAAPALSLGDATAVSQGDTVYFYGSPHGLDFTLARALVSHAGRALRGLTYLQVDGNVNPGNSGGPLLDVHGRVVGVVTLRVEDADGLGLALPVNYLWDGGEPLLAAPQGGGRSPGWETMVQQAVLADERDAAVAREQLSRPGLVGAFATQHGVVVTVVRQSELAPPAVNLDFRLEREGTATCWPTGAAAGWQPVGDAGEPIVDPGTRSWLARHGMSVAVWATNVRLAWAGCPPPEASVGQTLVLVEGMPGAERAQVERLPLHRFSR
jgi:serine protease Do